MPHHSVCTTSPSPQIIFVSFFLRGGDSCTQAIYKTHEKKGFFGGGGEAFHQINRPFPSSKKSHFQNEAKCETFVVKMSFICITIKNHFHINSFALSIALKVRFFGTRKWPVSQGSSDVHSGKIIWEHYC